MRILFLVHRTEDNGSVWEPLDQRFAQSRELVAVY